VNTGLDFDDASTARTEVSTEIDDMSEKLSFGSMYLSDGGTFISHSQGDSFDASRIARVRSKQSDLLRVPESSVPKVEFHKDTNLVSSSLLDLDDEDDCSESGTTGIKTTLEKKLSSETQGVNFHGEGDYSNFATAGSFIGDALNNDDIHASFYNPSHSHFTPASIAHTVNTSESRAEFYRGYSNSHFLSPSSIAGNTLRNTESRAEFYGGDDRSFAERKLKSDLRVGFYRVSCSDSEDPLSCRQKLEQPAMGCDDSLFQVKKEKPKQEKNGSNQNRSGSFFSSVTCCFAPNQL